MRSFTTSSGWADTASNALPDANAATLAAMFKLNHLYICMVSKKLFLKRVKTLNTFASKTRKASYSDLVVTKNILSFKRDNTQKYWTLNLDEVYNAYTKEDYFNTVVLKQYVTGRVFSPSLGLLIVTKLCDLNGRKLS